MGKYKNKLYFFLSCTLLVCFKQVDVVYGGAATFAELCTTTPQQEAAGDCLVNKVFSDLPNGCDREEFLTGLRQDCMEQNCPVTCGTTAGFEGFLLAFVQNPASCGITEANICSFGPLFTFPPTGTFTNSPTKSPTLPTNSPTRRPTESPVTESPTLSPVTASPTTSPTLRPTGTPSTPSPTLSPVTSSPSSKRDTLPPVPGVAFATRIDLWRLFLAIASVCALVSYI